jgi:hypothetical protein
MTDTLFNSTSRLAGETAAKLIGSRQERIIALLRERGPLAIWEIADILSVFDHQISGRFSELERQGLIRKSGERRTKPDTKCAAEVYCLAEQRPAPVDPGQLLGYPDSINVPDEGPFDRMVPLGSRDVAGVPYRRRSSVLGGVDLSWRFEFLECGGCGRPLRMFEEDAGSRIYQDGKAVTNRKRRVYKCGTPGCMNVWELMIVTELGKAPMPALVKKFI